MLLHIGALTHAFGCYRLAIVLSLGAEICLATAIVANAAVSEELRLEPTEIPLVPRVLRSMRLQLLAKHPEQPGDKPRRLFGERARYLLSAGGRADSQALGALKDQGIDILE